MDSQTTNIVGLRDGNVKSKVHEDLHQRYLKRVGRMGSLREGRPIAMDWMLSGGGVHLQQELKQNRQPMKAITDKRWQQTMGNGSQWDEYFLLPSIGNPHQGRGVPYMVPMFILIGAAFVLNAIFLHFISVTKSPQVKKRLDHNEDGYSIGRSRCTKTATPAVLHYPFRLRAGQRLVRRSSKLLNSTMERTAVAAEHSSVLPGTAVPDESNLNSDDTGNITPSTAAVTGHSNKVPCLIRKSPCFTSFPNSDFLLEDLKLVEMIGGGGFGQVWKATWRKTPVAAKVISGFAQANTVQKGLFNKFAAEVQMIKGMRHPNICLFVGACFEPPHFAIITELAANGCLWDALQLPLLPPYKACDGGSAYFCSKQSFKSTQSLPPKGTWPWTLVKRVAQGTAQGMLYLHSGKPPVLHRDLKSANILLDGSYTAKLCDFGLSRLKETHNRGMTGNCGTVQWMAPEVLDSTHYDEKADVFSYGIVCWELLTRERPYAGMNAIQCALAVLTRNQRPEIPSWCPASLSSLIRACLMKDPNKRPSFDQVLLALDAMP